MSLGKYILSKLPFFILNLIVFLFCAIIMELSETGIEFIIILASICFLPILIYILLEFFSKKKLYDELLEIGIVFLLSSAAVLALQQLSQCNESIDRYEALRKIGASRNQINKSILMEISTFFIMPLSLAIVHSIIGIKIVEDYLKTFGNYNILLSALVTALIFVVVYGGYFYDTYIGYKNVIDN